MVRKYVRFTDMILRAAAASEAYSKNSLTCATRTNEWHGVKGSTAYGHRGGSKCNTLRTERHTHYNARIACNLWIVFFEKNSVAAVAVALMSRFPSLLIYSLSLGLVENKPKRRRRSWSTREPPFRLCVCTEIFLNITKEQLRSRNVFVVPPHSHLMRACVSKRRIAM